MPVERGVNYEIRERCMEAGSVLWDVLELWGSKCTVGGVYVLWERVVYSGKRWYSAIAGGVLWD